MSSVPNAERSTSNQAFGPDDLWVITSYFNPCSYDTKRDNFRAFQEGLRESKANLLVVEMALPGHDFEIDGAERVVRVRGECVMWQKERLLNLALEELPVSCAKVAWLDCDLVFENREWPRETARALETHSVVQPFEHCVRLPRGHRRFRGRSQENHPITESFAAAFARDPDLAVRGRYEQHGHTGFAWAARREVLDAVGLYDACLSGSGDHLMAHAFSGSFSSACIGRMIGTGNAYAEHFQRWAERMDDVVKGGLGHVPGRVLHLWHGSITDRRYYERNKELQALEFDPERHIRLGRGGLWEWDDAPPAMRAWARRYFTARAEDGEGGARPDGAVADRAPQ